MNKKFILSFIWLGFTTALGSWWVYFSYLQYSSLKQSRWEHATDILRYQKMLIYEGAFFLLLVILGGSALLYFTLNETKRLKEREAFFSAFTHDLKTTITNLKLTLESLLQKKSEISASDLKKIFNDSHHLGLQLENSLMLARQKDLNVFLKKVPLTSLLGTLKQAWPELEVRVSGGVNLWADPVLLTSVLSNLFQNAMVHGEAKSIEIQVDKSQSPKVTLSVVNDGKNFDGDYSRLGTEYFYRGEYRGSGMGLFICKTLTKKMNGDLVFKPVDKKFCAELTLNESVDQ